MKMPTDNTKPFGETGALQEVFAEVKKRRPARSPAHVLVVEDDLLTSRIVTSTFKQTYAMIAAGDAHEAVADYMTHAPDIVFLDIGLPGLDGFAALHEIISIDPNAYIVMLSGNTNPENINRAMAEGARGFISKPFTRETLNHYILGSKAHHQPQGGSHG